MRKLVLREQPQPLDVPRPQKPEGTIFERGELRLVEPLNDRQLQDVVEEGHEHAGMEALVDPIVDLHQHGGGDDQGLLGFLDEAPARRVVGIASVERGVQWTRIEDQRHERGSGRSRAVRRAVSEWPEAPMPKLRGRGRCFATVSSSASRTKAAIEVRRSAAIDRTRSRRPSGSEMVIRSMA
jgi:hypothetical protein